MASRAISGKPGGGKSYLATRWVLKELLESSRPIVTNVPLVLPAIVKYCISKGREDVDVYNRIILLPWEETKAFWRWRGRPNEAWCKENGVDIESDDYRERGWIAAPCDQDAYKRGERPAIASFPPGGVYYVLDELHEHLNSREWAATGGAVLYYLAKHRHLGDDIVWITQSCANVDKQWRSVTQDYTYCRNWAKEKWHGWAKGSGFQAVTYLDMVTGSSPPAPSETVNYKLESDVTACYRTSIVGQAADTAVKQKAFSIKWVYAGIALLAILVSVLFIFGPDAATRLLVGRTQPKSVAVHPGGSSGLASARVKDAVLVVPVDGQADAAYFAKYSPLYDPERQQVVVAGPSRELVLVAQAFQVNRVVFWLAGSAKMDGGRYFVVTDRGAFAVGDWCSSPAGVVEAITPESITVAGVEYPLRWPSIRAVASVPDAPSPQPVQPVEP